MTVLQRSAGKSGQPVGGLHEAGRAAPWHQRRSPRGGERFRYRGRDFADRPDDDDVIGALDEIGARPRRNPLPVPSGRPAPGPKAFRFEALTPYFTGVRTITKALGGRLEEHAGEIGRANAMAERFLAAIKETRALRETREAG